MSKRVYVAVGSVGVNCLKSLVTRYKDEGLFNDTEDAFVGMDTHQAKVDELKALEGSNKHITGISVIHEEADSPVRELVHSFRSRDWDSKAKIPMDGVGGDRKLSFMSLRWSADPELLKRVKSLVKGDQLILIGTAFGGTSTGMFWNVATWLRAQIPRDAENNAAHFYSFLVLPEDQGGDLEKYPWSFNLCAFMQDMQSLEVGTRITSCLGAQIPFLLPSFPLYSKDVAKNVVPVWSRDRFGFSAHTFLPCDRVFVVPTPPGLTGAAFVPDIVAEQAFVLGALGGWDMFKVAGQTIDLARLTGDDYTKPDYAFGGFNMVAGQSARREALRRVFCKKLHERYNFFLAQGGEKAAHPGLLGALKKAALNFVMDADSQGIPQAVSGHKQAFEAILEDRHLSSAEMTRRLEVKLADLHGTLSGKGYRWLGYPEFVKRCEEWVKPYIDSNEAAFLTLTDVYELYVDVRKQILKEAGQFEEVRSRILCLPAERGRIVESRRSRLAVKMLGAGDAVEAEVVSHFKRAEVEYLDWYISCCRAVATRNQLMDDVAVVEAGKGLVRSYNQRLKPAVEQVCEGLVQESLPKCIYQDNSTVRDLSDTLIIKDGIFLSLFLGGAEGAVASLAERIRVLEQSAVVELAEQARRKGPGNPLKTMVVNLSAGNPQAFSEVFELKDAAQWHQHFYIEHGNVAPICWKDIKRFSSAFQATFGSLLSGALSPDKDVRPADLKGSFYSARQSQENDEIHGVWIGTVQLDATIAEILKKTYMSAGKPVNIWENRAAARVKEGAPQRSLLSLAENLALGVILGGIDKKARTLPDLATKGCTVRIEGVKGSGFALKAFDVGMYFVQSGAGYKLENISPEWVKPMMEWIDGSFWQETGMPELQLRLAEMERAILSTMNLAIGAAELREPLIKLAEVVHGKIHIDVG